MDRKGTLCASSGLAEEYVLRRQVVLLKLSFLQKAQSALLQIAGAGCWLPQVDLNGSNANSESWAMACEVLNVWKGASILSVKNG